MKWREWWRTHPKNVDRPLDDPFSGPARPHMIVRKDGSVEQFVPLTTVGPVGQELYERVAAHHAAIHHANEHAPGLAELPDLDDEIKGLSPRLRSYIEDLEDALMDVGTKKAEDAIRPWWNDQPDPLNGPVELRNVRDIVRRRYQQ